MATLHDPLPDGPFNADPDSLTAFEVPAWYIDGKFGIFIHWGVYSVPAFGNEWYPRQMYLHGSREFAHHIATYGPQKDFGYKDFIPRFKAEKYDPDAWAELFADSGARFVVPVAEHHDGFPMYDSALTEWCAGKKGPQRDLIGDLAASVRARGMVFGVSSHRAEHWWFFDGGRKFDSDVNDPANDGLYGPARPGPTDHHDFTQGSPDEAFLEDWLARCCELVDTYRPQLVWFDWWIQQEAFTPYRLRFAAYYYNRANQWGVEVAINYKYEAFPTGAAVLDIERGQLADIRPYFWQNDTAVAKNSWGYIDGLEYKTPTSLIQDLVDIVSKNGALLLNIGPRPDGTIPEGDTAILREIGRWLSVNGEAIYGTRPWRVYGEGPTPVPEGAFTDTNRAAFTAEDIRFTTKGDVLYATLLAWPESGTARIATDVGDIATVTLLGHDGDLPFARTPSGGVDVFLPAAPPEPGHAFVLKVE